MAINVFSSSIYDPNFSGTNGDDFISLGLIFSVLIISLKAAPIFLSSLNDTWSVTAEKLEL